jgi:hypothetical protein
MEHQSVRQTVRKTFKEKLRPTPVQEMALAAVLWRCRMLYNTALERRITLKGKRTGEGLGCLAGPS